MNDAQRMSEPKQRAADAVQLLNQLHGHALDKQCSDDAVRARLCALAPHIVELVNQAMTGCYGVAHLLAKDNDQLRRERDAANAIGRTVVGYLAQVAKALAEGLRLQCQTPSPGVYWLSLANPKEGRSWMIEWNESHGMTGASDLGLTTAEAVQGYMYWCRMNGRSAGDFDACDAFLRAQAAYPHTIRPLDQIINTEDRPL